eukprot:TRINITY_DN13284_c0_g2_i3.p1 TRINITY_DN13284_c0_g2~~TRINITY_DN13284_c0_g2_i3.p1  ORF type:complete len:293 (+),score=51.10 TRINITY_DN13284_c0_g2_i3:74-952(+)
MAPYRLSESGSVARAWWSPLLLAAALGALSSQVYAFRNQRSLSDTQGAAASEEEEFAVLQAGHPIFTPSGVSYTVSKFLGSGAYGKVYKAEDKFGSGVVAKFIDLSQPEAVQSFQQEAHIFGHFKRCKGYPHPNIIEYKEVFQSDKSTGIVIMEMAGGGSLMGKLYDGVTVESGDRNGVRTEWGTALLTNETEAQYVFGQIASGIAWLAGCGIMHQDLKPDNIMFTSGGQPKIIDFGLATVTSDSAGPDANMYYNLQSQPDRREIFFMHVNQLQQRIPGRWASMLTCRQRGN